MIDSYLLNLKTNPFVIRGFVSRDAAVLARNRAHTIPVENLVTQPSDLDAISAKTLLALYNFLKRGEAIKRFPRGHTPQEHTWTMLLTGYGIGESPTAPQPGSREKPYHVTETTTRSAVHATNHERLLRETAAKNRARAAEAAERRKRK